MSQSKEERVHEVFESIYHQYDKMNSVISFRLHKSWRRKTMEAMDVRNGAQVLDVCCGTADWTIDLGKAAGKEGSVTGVDFSDNMLNVGREKIQKEKLPSIKLKKANAMKLPFEDQTFDYVTIGFGLRNVADYQTVLHEMFRVLKPGGKAVCLETSMPENKYIHTLYSVYFTYFMPVLGKLFAGSYDEYSWLQESTAAFPNKNLLTFMFSRAGFKQIEVTSYSMGTAAAHFARKPGAVQGENIHT
ncbi:demethylmenaquinone methyltransferase [Salibacterium aidingense]|uniref:demethylmenaquinone methyltransferase n=1 Tax=Salibacterium aidingense TaxID=384933 RepID=UPI0004220EFA|nr:demethylmenaquinone methyltransferase [Salibacterium aidingense]